jgi:hypothetical protein
MSDKNNDMALGIAIGGAGGLCLFVIYKLFSSMSETREQLRKMRTPTPSPPPDWGPKSGYPHLYNDYEFPVYQTIGGKRKSRRKSRKSRKSRRKLRKSRKSRKNKKKITKKKAL